jgi:hypothetical protein
MQIEGAKTAAVAARCGMLLCDRTAETCRLTPPLVRLLELNCSAAGSI